MKGHLRAERVSHHPDSHALRTLEITSMTNHTTTTPQMGNNVPTRKRVKRVVQQHQPHKQPTQKAAVGGFDGLTIALLLMNAVLVAWAVLA
jgi:hypothetical protein